MTSPKFQPTVEKVIPINSALPPATDGSELRPARILIAHQYPERLAELRAILASDRYIVFSMNTTTELVTRISSEHCDLVLMDVELPGAIELCQTLKKADSTQFLPIFFTSRNNDVDLEVRAINSGADAFVPEPFRLDAIKARIESSLRQRRLIESLDDSETVLFSLAQSVEERDPGLGLHCERLAQMCSAMGHELGLPPSDIITLQRAGYLHDIGKVAIPDQILFKQGALTADEWSIMESHAERGERICRNIRSLINVLPVIRHHHEKWNGTGYPDRLKGEEIPLLARVLQLADIYDALTTARPYKRAFTAEEAVQIMRDEAAKGWRDPALTERFAGLLPRFHNVELPQDLCQLSLRALASSLTVPRREPHLQTASRLSQAVNGF